MDDGKGLTVEASTDTNAIGGQPSVPGAPTDAPPAPIDPRLLETTVISRIEVDAPAAPPVAPPDPTPAPPAPGRELSVVDSEPETTTGDATVDSDEPLSGARLIRPYAMTGGRTASHSDISLESQVQTSTRLDLSESKYRWEAAKILKLAERPMALVELAARAAIPIGVARVVVSDLVDEGAVNVQRNVAVTSYTSLLEKVLDGIRDL